MADRLGLPRLRAHVDNERIRLQLPVDDVHLRRDHCDALPAGGLGEITAQLFDEAEIRSLLAAEPVLACRRAQAWVERLRDQRRPRALLQANRLLVATLRAADRTAEAKQVLTTIATQCAERGMVRYLLDGGPQVVALLTELNNDLRSGRWQSTWPAAPDAFLDRVVNRAG